MGTAFEHRVVLVSGASRGIGAAIAQAFAREGAAVLVNYRQQRDNAEAVAAACRAAG
ncbi:SDR family NAD(P)-dependent oxidoreductase, partial [Salmonella enterica]|uniref:SDR family NAD(P)-dependent oxidoreductase n=1 Tax=Salmonella enterica TaxID=28901 RepID=UPI003D2A8066